MCDSNTFKTVNYTPQTDPSYNQEHHLENPAGFMDDMQSIFQDRSGLWHVYYLNEPTWGINNEIGNSNWQHATSIDGTHWVNDSDIAIKSRKLDPTVKWGSVATGSVVISDGSIAGTTDGDFVAFFSSYGAVNCGEQSIWAAISKDNGHSYQPLSDLAVMPNLDNYPDFRDPYVMKYNGQWVMYMAEGDKVGTYSSTDGQNWSYIGSTSWNPDAFLDGKDHGIVECPYVVTMMADDGTRHAVQFVGANDYNWGYTTGTSYLIGSIDSSGIFTKQNDQTLPVRIDLGTDYYGSNFGKVDEQTLITSSWVNNWAYANEKVIGIDGNQTKKGTTCALFRDIKMVKDASAPSGYSLQLFVRDVVDRTFPTNDDYNVYHDIPSGGEYLRTIDNSKVVDFDIQGGQPGGVFVVDVRQDDNISTLMFDINGGWIRTKRSMKGNFNNSTYNVETKNITYGKPGLTDTHLTIYFDTKSIEIEFTDSHQVYTLLKWGKKNNRSTTLSLQGGNMPVSVNCKEYDYR
ncbi:GH32 family (SacC) [Fructobacillus tropaeoli]|nr:GH32 family (SacC) [Fructobacillus tropaeoli]